jgi:hypothetical protein
MSKTDNLFKKILEDENLQREYGITDVDRYQNIAAGMRSTNGYVVAIATALDQINKTVEDYRMDMKIRNQSGPINELKDRDSKSIYRKIITLLEKA